MRPQKCSPVGTRSACKEVADHVNHVETAASLGRQTIDPSLIRNMTCLYAQIKKDHSQDESPQLFRQMRTGR